MLQVTLQDWKKWKPQGRTLAVFAFQGETPEFLRLAEEASGLAALAKIDGFKGKERETLLLRPAQGSPAERLLLIGLGKRAEFTPEVLRRAASKAIRGAEALGLTQVAIRAPEIARANPEKLKREMQALAEGLSLATYRFDRHRTPSDETPKALGEAAVWVTGNVASLKPAIARANVFARAVMLARDLVNEPPSLMNPERLAKEALKLNQAPLTVRVLEKKELEKLNMGGILGVGAGGAVPPRLVELIYRPSQKARKVVALVGKGITFDSGGLSLKPAQSMETMKDDMSGAAAVLGVFSALPALKPKVEVRGYLALAENLPSGSATKPGDVLKTHKGKSIEVLNTDAEGRLVLADALAYAGAQKPDMMVDIATLTGACVVALGHAVAGVMGNNPALVRQILNAGELSGERFWELPLVKEYQQDIRSKIADVKNIGSRRGEAGTIIGGLFLQEFVDQVPWVHLDIAGPSWVDSDQPYCPTGGTGHPVRTLLHLLENLS